MNIIMQAANAIDARTMDGKRACWLDSEAEDWEDEGGYLCKECAEREVEKINAVRGEGYVQISGLYDTPETESALFCDECGCRLHYSLIAPCGTEHELNVWPRDLTDGHDCFDLYQIFTAYEGLKDYDGEWCRRRGIISESQRKQKLIIGIIAVTVLLHVGNQAQGESKGD